jgi:Family of unknown function (DUF6131)
MSVAGVSAGGSMGIGFLTTTGGIALIILGIICLILAAIFNLGFLWVIGVILVILGLIFWILGAMGRAVGGRRHYY